MVIFDHGNFLESLFEIEKNFYEFFIQKNI